jgi:hypothetical protein
MKTSKRPQKAQKFILRSIHGTVRVYTPRHINGCPLRDRDANTCSCPKWIYSKGRGGKPVQQSARTPSFAEACEEASRILAGFNPEIAAAREINEPEPGIGIEACVELYAASLRRRSLSASRIHNCLVPFQRRKPVEYTNGRALNLSLLDYLDRQNASAREPVLRMEQVTSDILDQWVAGWGTNDLSTRTWRGNVATFMKWAKTHDHIDSEPEFREPHRVKPGNRCGYLDDGQIAKLYAALPFFKPLHMPENFAARLGAFIDAGRWGGMALCDIVLFSPRLNLSSNNVLTYRRRKSAQIATVLLDPAVAARLRSIPPEKGSEPDQPFRLTGTREVQNRQLWRERFESLCRFVGITEVETEVVGKIPPHPQMLRDSLAIGAITHGVSLENVARMLGHKTTAMTQRSYLFWVKKRVDHCIEDQRLALARHAQEAQAQETEAVKPADQQVIQ